MKKLFLIVAAMIIIAAPAYAQASWSDGFDYPDGNLFKASGAGYPRGIWVGGTETAQINVQDGTVHVTNSPDDRYVRGEFETSFTDNIIIATLQVNRTATDEWIDGWLGRIMYKDSNGLLLAQWQLASCGGNGRISTSTTQTAVFNQGWNDLKAVIDMNTNTTEYFVNNVSIGTTAFDAGAVNELVSITIYKGMDSRAAANGAPDLILDNFSVAAVPEPGSIVALCSGLVGMVGFARRRRA